MHRGLKIVLMTVENIFQKDPEIFTLCFKDDHGDVNPIVDFYQIEHATKLAALLNKSGYFIKLNDLCNEREIEVYLKKAEAKAPVGKFSRLEDALKYLNIKVDFEVEPPEDALNLNDKNLFFY